MVVGLQEHEDRAVLLGGVTQRAGPKAVSLFIDPFDSRIIQSITNKGSEGTEPAHCQGKK